MRYVPDLIPKKWKVLPDYFKGGVYQSRKPNTVLSALGWIFGLFLIFGALASLPHPPLAVVFGLLGFILLPPGHRWLERVLSFRFTTGFKSAVGAVLFLGAMPLSSHYSKVDKKEAQELKLQADLQQKKDEEQRLVAEEKDRQRKDSLSFHLKKSAGFAAKHKNVLALKQLESAVAFATTPDEEKQLVEEKEKLAILEVVDLIKAGRYQAAIPKLNVFLAADGNNAEMFYNRAICYSKTGKILMAVNDCKTAIELGSRKATSLHEKINPRRRRVAYYVTRCCDGSTSSATGRGACSHHGGVCNWNDPVYEEYRKYE